MSRTVTTEQTVLQLKGVTRTFTQGASTLEVLKGINLSIQAGERVALVAPSGTGKSTLLHIAGLLEHPTAGEIWVNGQEMSRARDSVRTRVRRSDVGFMYQFHHLLPEFSALENVMMPLKIAGQSTPQNRAKQLLDAVGLSDRLNHRPGMLSGGEQQRVALCRALANGPRVILADEPTGNLDVETTDHVFDLLSGMIQQEGLGALIATHNPDLAKRMDRIVTIHNGIIEDHTP